MPKGMKKMYSGHMGNKSGGMMGPSGSAYAMGMNKGGGSMNRNAMKRMGNSGAKMSKRKMKY